MLKSTPAACIDCAYLDQRVVQDRNAQQGYHRQVLNCKRYKKMAYVSVEMCAFIPRYLEILADTPRVLAADMNRDRQSLCSTG